jgi:hypothetical protein
MRRRFYFFLLLFLVAAPAYAQEDGFNLPAALYVLTNDGMIQRYGQGAEGITTVSPADVFIVDFGVSPDDNWIAYRTENALTIANRTTEETYLVESELASVPSVRGEGDTIAWSPAGDAIAVTTLYGGRIYINPSPSSPVASWQFTPLDLREGAFIQVLWSPDGRFLAAEVEGNIWWIYRRDGQNMVLTSAIPSAVDVAWVANSELVFAPAEGGLVLMRLDQANAQTILLSDGSNYSLPYLMPDGLLAFFGRQKDDTETEPGFGWLVGLRAGAASVENTGEIPVNLTGLRWSPGGDFMISFQDGIFSVVNPINGQGFALPVSAVVAYTWGPPLAAPTA